MTQPDPAIVPAVAATVADPAPAPQPAPVVAEPAPTAPEPVAVAAPVAAVPVVAPVAAEVSAPPAEAAAAVEAPAAPVAVPVMPQPTHVVYVTAAPNTAAVPVPVAAVPKRTPWWQRIVHGLAAAVTSPDAIRQERSLAALIAVRLLLAIGAGTGLAELIAKAIHG